MTVEAELFDGTILEFPDGTSPGIIQAKVKQVTLSRQPKEPLTGAQKFVRQSALPTIGGFAGGTLGALLPIPGAAAAGAVLGSMGGEALQQYSEPVREWAGVETGPLGQAIQTGLAGAGPLLGPISSRLPGSSTALREAGGELVEKIPGKILPSVASESLFARLKNLNPLVKLPNLNKVADDIAKAETGLAEFGFSNADILKTAEKISAKTGDVPFQVVMDVRRRIGERISSLRASTDPRAVEGLSAYKQMFKELSDDLEHAASTGGKGGVFELFKQANEAAKREFASQELDEVFRTTVGKAKEAVEGIVPTSFAQAYNKVRELRLENNGDNLFAKSFKPGELAEIEKTLKNLSEIPMPQAPKNLAVGSALFLANRAGTGSIAALLGKQFGIDPMTAVAGTWASQWILEKMISSAVQTGPGRKVLMSIYQSPGGLTPAKVGVLINLTRKPVMDELQSMMAGQGGTD